MGVKGAASYFHDLSIVNASPSPKDRQNRAWDDVFRCDHLLVDMNCVLHNAFKSTTEKLSDFLLVLNDKLKSLLKVFTPRRSLSLIFDGVAPLSKLSQQRRRRAKLPEMKSPLPKNFATSKTPFCHEEILIGSPFLWACEKQVEMCIPSILKELYHHEEIQVFWSGSTDPGEGEVKISFFLNHFFQEKEALATDTISIVGNDSDLVLVGLLATPFENVSVVHPESLEVTRIPLLLNKWRAAVPNPPLHSSLLQTYRIDFTFIMLCVGTDYYSGIAMNDARAVWSTYRRLRCNEGYFKVSLVNAEKECEINIGFLRVLLSSTVKRYMSGKCRKNTTVKCNISAGKETLIGAMWALQTFAHGNCANMNFMPLESHSCIVSLKSLEQAAKQKNIELEVKNVQRIPEWITSVVSSSNSVLDEKTKPLLTPLEQYISVVGKRGRYSPAVCAAIDRLSDQGNLITNGSSIGQIVESVKQVMSSLNLEALYEHEQEMMRFKSRPGNPVLLASTAA